MPRISGNLQVAKSSLPQTHWPATANDKYITNMTPPRKYKTAPQETPEQLNSCSRTPAASKLASQAPNNQFAGAPINQQLSTGAGKNNDNQQSCAPRQN